MKKFNRKAYNLWSIKVIVNFPPRSLSLFALHITSVDNFYNLYSLYSVEFSASILFSKFFVCSPHFKLNFHVGFFATAYFDSSFIFVLIFILWALGSIAWFSMIDWSPPGIAMPLPLKILFMSAWEGTYYIEPMKILLAFRINVLNLGLWFISFTYLCCLSVTVYSTPQWLFHSIEYSTQTIWTSWKYASIAVTSITSGPSAATTTAAISEYTKSKSFKPLCNLFEWKRYAFILHGFKCLSIFHSPPIWTEKSNFHPHKMK